MANTRKEVLTILFAQYPDEKGFHLTSDNQAFRLEADAVNQAKTLEDKSVEWCKNTPSTKASDGSKESAEVVETKSKGKKGAKKEDSVKEENFKGKKDEKEGTEGEDVTQDETEEEDEPEGEVGTEV